MSGFSMEWLKLREPLDARARATELVERVAAGRAGDAPLEVVDLGAGGGANLRWLAPRLRGAQRWRLVDDDAPLLAAGLAATRAWADANGFTAEDRDGGLAVTARTWSCAARVEPLDLAAALDRLELPRGCLVTASALLDLVSTDWLRALAARCRAADARVLFALSYDGRTTCLPAEPADAEVLELFNRHQRGDKGFGAALGPNAARATVRIFAEQGYELATATSDWRIAPRDAAPQRALLDGWLGAALEIAPQRRAALEEWRRRREAHVAASRSTLVVGHVDIAGQLGR